MLGEYLDASLPWLELARELGIQFFAHAHGYDVSMRLREPRYRHEYLRYRDAAGVITMSESSRTRLIDLGLAPEQTHAVPYGVDVPDAFDERSPSAEVAVLAVGRMIPKKAPLLTLDAFRRALAASTGLHLHFVGAGPLLPAAAQFVRTMQLDHHVTLHGGQQNAVVQDLMTSADIFVQHSVTDPDTGDEEGLPVAILEAMARGLPVVATRHAAIPEAVVDSVTGFLVTEGDVQTMAARITQLAEDRALRLAMGRAGWARARERFSWPRERHDLLRILGI
jgi:colanic acid/amylovoran biosynthesis glycosyltransferase